MGLTEHICMAKELCRPYGTLVYLVKFGSHLYGTNTAQSDTDYKGLFLPHKENLLLGRKCNSVHSNTGSGVTKNTSDDVDINIWSVHYWLQLLRTGDTNAIDLLYAHTHQACVMYTHPSLGTPKVLEITDYKDNVWYSTITQSQSFFENPELFLNIKDNRAYIQYAYNQAKKYGLKGSRMEVLENIRSFVGKITNHSTLFGCTPTEEKFGDYIPKLVEMFGSQYCKMGKTRDGRELLYILGKGFEPTITIQEAYNRLDTAWQNYGERARLAKENKGVDWKAISHALRCIYQVEEIIDTGTLKFPLTTASELIDVKQGKRTWEQCNAIISEGLDRVGRKLEGVQRNNDISIIHTSFILSHYQSEVVC